jgi:alpha-L-fucosidase
MLTRREFCNTLGGATAVALLGSSGLAVEADGQPDRPGPEPYVDSQSLLQRQQAFLDLRFGMFLHFNMATFQNREWGDPHGPMELFDPDALDTDEWAKAALSANMKYGCLTTKHHDGFCLWPTKTGADCILSTPRKIDVVKAYTDSFRNHGLTVGLYFSILDLRGDIRHHNVTPEKVARIKAQLTELLTDYGKIDLLIFDGWDAPWSRLSYEEVPFNEIYALIKRLQPGCMVSELNASQYPPSALFYSDIKAFEQNAGQHLPGQSRIPAQSCVTLTNGWFWKTGDDSAELKPAETVVEKWLIPQNKLHCNLILNAPPDRHGRLTPNVLARLEEIGRIWKNSGPAEPIDPSIVITTLNLAQGRPIHASDSADAAGPDEANDGNFNSAWCLREDRTEGWLEVDLGTNVSFNTLVLTEPFGSGRRYATSRIAKYRFEAFDGQSWREIAAGDLPQQVRMHSIPRTQADKVRVLLWAQAGALCISEIGVYDEPARIVRTL